jgi:peroxiredoxin
MVSQRFDKASPAVGDPLPDVTALDAEGRPLRLSELKGQYTVLVFGCLT